MDTGNRYLPSVRVETASKEIDGQSGCSGVLVSPRLVVTAGHCVCKKRKLAAGDQAKVAAAVTRSFSSRPDLEKEAILGDVLREASMVIDRSECAKLSLVSVITYPPAAARRKGSGRAPRTHTVTEYDGDIVAHDDLLVVYNSNDLTVFKETDLAAIVLRERVNVFIPQIKLAMSEVQVGDPVVIVGYGPGTDDTESRRFGMRFFGESRVVHVARSESGNVQFFTGNPSNDGGVAANVEHGDSGGPCFSKTDATMLVGIANAQSEDEGGMRLSIFTSIYPHVAWLKKIEASTSHPSPE